MGFRSHHKLRENSPSDSTLNLFSKKEKFLLVFKRRNYHLEVLKLRAWVRIPEMGTLISIPGTLFSRWAEPTCPSYAGARGPAGEATAAGDDHSPTWATVEKVVSHDKTDDRSYADVCRAGFEQGSLSQLRRRHFAKQPQKAPKDRQVQVQESVRLQSNHC